MRIWRVKIRQISMILLLLAFLSTGIFHPARAGTKYKKETFKCGKYNRVCYVYVPSSLDKEKKPPLLIVLHGGGGTWRGMVRLTGGKFDKLADKEGFIVVYPDAIDKHWNDGRGLENRKSNRENVDDVGFISKIIDLMAKQYNIDGTRVYATGISNGGMMSYRLALDLTGKIAAIAPVTASMGENISRTKTPSAPISALIMNGTKDPLVPYNGGEVHFGKTRHGMVISTQDTVKYFVKYNGCSSSPVTASLPDTNKLDKSSVKREIYSGGKNNTEVILYQVEGGGHTWPGGFQYLPASMIGVTNRDIDACGIIWEFFKRHKR